MILKMVLVFDDLMMVLVWMIMLDFDDLEDFAGF